MNWLKKLRVHLRPYLLLTATAIATVMELYRFYKIEKEND